MKDKLYIQTKLLDLSAAMRPQSMDESLAHRAKIDTISWVYHNGNIRPESEVRLKLQNAEEELLALQFMQDKSYNNKIVNAKINVLKDILN